MESLKVTLPEGPKGKKKVYAVVRALITFTTNNHADADALTRNFLQRRGLILVDGVEYTGKKERTVKFEVDYKVHGGWRSDFVKKVESDAADLGIEVQNLDVVTTRTEIPGECPRKECVPCSIAIDPSKSYSFAHKPDTVKEVVEPEVVKPRSRWKIFN